MPPASPEHYPGIPAAYNSPIIKLLQLRATLSDEDNVIAKRGTRGGNLYITSFVTRGDTSLEQGCLPAIVSSLNQKDRGRQQTYECTYNNQVNCITTYQEYEV